MTFYDTARARLEFTRSSGNLSDKDEIELIVRQLITEKAKEKRKGKRWDPTKNPICSCGDIACETCYPDMD